MGGRRGHRLQVRPGPHRLHGRMAARDRLCMCTSVHSGAGLLRCLPSRNGVGGGGEGEGGLRLGSIETLPAACPRHWRASCCPASNLPTARTPTAAVPPPNRPFNRSATPSLEYKFVVVQGGGVVAWSADPNRKLDLTGLPSSGVSVAEQWDAVGTRVRDGEGLKGGAVA